MTKTKTRITEDQKLRRRAVQKVEREKAKLAKEIPLFADQVPLPTHDEAYWQARKSWAVAPRGFEAAYLAGVDYKIDVMILRNLARRAMSPEDFELACSKSDKFGSRDGFWRNILLGQQRIVIAYERISHGWAPTYFPANEYRGEDMRYFEKVELREKLVWPPPGYQPPMTKEQLDAHVALPIAADFPQAVDPLDLGNA